MKEEECIQELQMANEGEQIPTDEDQRWRPIHFLCAAIMALWGDQKVLSEMELKREACRVARWPGAGLTPYPTSRVRAASTGPSLEGQDIELGSEISEFCHQEAHSISITTVLRAVSL